MYVYMCVYVCGCEVYVHDSACVCVLICIYMNVQVFNIGISSHAFTNL